MKSGAGVGPTYSPMFNARVVGAGRPAVSSRPHTTAPGSRSTCSNNSSAGSHKSRTAAVTVPWPEASMAPTSRSWGFRQVGLVNSVAKGTRTAAIASGRVSMVRPFSESGGRPAYPVFILFLNCVESLA